MTLFVYVKSSFLLPIWYNINIYVNDEQSNLLKLKTLSISFNKDTQTDKISIIDS